MNILQNILILNTPTIIHLVRIALFSFFISIIVTAQSDTVFYSGDYRVKIDSIKIIGNETTKEFVILRELTIGIGDTLNPELASYDRERIYSLRIFIDVKLKPFSYEGKNTLLIVVEESWYIYPIPILFLK